MDIENQSQSTNKENYSEPSLKEEENKCSPSENSLIDQNTTQEDTVIQNESVENTKEGKENQRLSDVVIVQAEQQIVEVKNIQVEEQKPVEDIKQTIVENKEVEGEIEIETTKKNNPSSEKKQETESEKISYKVQNQKPSHPESEYLKIHSYGFGGIRYNNVVMLSQSEALIPIGPNIARWDVERGKRLQVVQTNHDSIFVMTERRGMIISISHSGQVSFTQKQGLNLIGQFKTQGRLVRHASASSNYLCISCEDYQDQRGSTEVYNLDVLMQCLGQSDELENMPEEDHWPPIHLHLKGRYRFGHLTDKDQLVILKERPVEQQQQQKEQKDNVQEKLHKKQKTKKVDVYHDIELYDLETKGLKTTSSLPYVRDIVSTSTNGSTVGAYLYQDRNLLIVDFETLKILSFSQIEGKGTIMTSTFTEPGVLLLSTAPNVLLFVYVFSLSDNQLPNKINDKQTGQFGSYELRSLKSRAAHPENYFLSLQKESLFAANEGGFIVTNISNPILTSSYSGMSITCCGVATNSTSSMVAVGDFVGNVNIFPADCCHENEPIFQTCVMSSIRSLEWDPNDSWIMIGTMEGHIYRWFYQEFGQQSQLICHLKGSVTALRHKSLNIHFHLGRSDGTILLLASTTEGQFGIFQDNYGQNMKMLSLTYGHLPQSACQRFGSLEKFAEIWSCCWSCKDEKTMATCSEDQTVHIFDLDSKQPMQINELKGHELAATSIDWKEMGEGLGEIFVSCSDDQTIRVYDPKNLFEMINIFTTSFVREWHTLTYLSLEEGGTRIAIGSQNGYFFIYDLKKNKFTFSEKIHMGGIEGVIWGSKRIFTCSSDCSVNIIEF